MRKAGTIFTLLWLLSTTAFAHAHETGFLDRTVTIGAETYRFEVFVPANWDKHKKWPVVLFLHGAGERGDDGLLPTDVGIGHAIRQKPANWPMIVVMPQCRMGSLWTDSPMQAQALSALKQSIREFHGDPQRVYLTGLSMGGYGTWDIGAKYPHTFAALVPICGGIRAPADFPDLRVSLVNDPSVSDPYLETARRIGKTPVWIFDGADDPTVPAQESHKMMEAGSNAKGDFRMIEFPGVGHNSWDLAYGNSGLVPWLLEQRLLK